MDNEIYIDRFVLYMELYCLFYDLYIELNWLLYIYLFTLLY